MYKLINFLVFINVIFIISCSPKIKQIDNKTPISIETEVSEKPEVQRASPCKMFSDYRDPDEVMSYYTIYRNFLKSNEYDQAYENWLKAFHMAPASNGKVKYQYDDGIKIYKHFYQVEKDTIKRLKWIDSIDQIYVKRLECFGDPAYVSGKKAFDYYYNMPNIKSKDSIYTWFKKSADIKKAKSDYFIINPFTKLLLEQFEAKKIDTAETKYYANILNDAIIYGSTNCKEDECKNWEVIKGYAPFLLESFEQIQDFYSPEYYKNKYLDLYNSNRDSCETVNLIYRKLIWGGCDLKEPEFSDIINDIKGKCYIAPPEPGPLTKAYDYYNDGKYRKAIESFEDFIEKTDDKDKKAKYTLLISKIYYGDLKNFPQARKYALKAASLKTGWGEPYMLIGKLYASSGPLCGPGTGYDSQLVTWPAIDKFEYAKKIDPSVSNEANKLINNYTRFMPSQEDIHQRLLKEGQKLTVGCWINEVTTIRAAKD